MGLFEIRSILGLGQRKIADESRVSQSMVAKTETGTANPTAHILKAIAKTVCCTVDDILAETLPASRLSEIRAAYHQREADRAREEAKAAS